MEKIIERAMFASRWLVAPLYLGMSLILLALGFKFFQEVFHLFMNITVIKETELVLIALGLIDLLLVSGLIIMVMFSGYENFVSKIDLHEDAEKLSWLGTLDTGSLKLKVAASIVAISSIHMLKKFMESDIVLARMVKDQTTEQIANIPLHLNPLFWQVIMHLTFVVSAVMMGYLDKMSFAAHRKH